MSEHPAETTGVHSILEYIPANSIFSPSSSCRPTKSSSSSSMPRVALVVIDVQEDFLPPSGSLAVKDGRSIIPAINGLLDLDKYPWAFVAATQDWHPANHCSFASQHNLAPYSEKVFEHPLGEIDPITNSVKVKKFTLWPDHCVQGTAGSSLESSFAEALDSVKSKVPSTITKKGYLQDREYYSCLADSWGIHHTELEAQLKSNHVSHVVLVGLAYDFCVLNSAIDFVKAGFLTFVVTPLSKSVYPGSLVETDELYERAGVTLLRSVSDLESVVFGKDFSSSTNVEESSE